MMLQEKELEKLKNQEGRSTGKGPTKAARDARDRMQQFKMAEEFVNILDDEEAIRLEAEEATNPATFIPGKKSRHKPPKRLKYGVEENKDKNIEEDENEIMKQNKEIRKERKHNQRRHQQRKYLQRNQHQRKGKRQNQRKVLHPA